jgi:hypothetical protein
MTQSPSPKREHRVLKADKSLADHASELAILLKVDETQQKKIPAARLNKILDDLQHWAIEQFVAHRDRHGKVPD